MTGISSSPDASALASASASAASKSGDSPSAVIRGSASRLGVVVVAHDLDRDVGDRLGAGGGVGRDLGAGGGLGGGLDRGEGGLAVDLACRRPRLRPSRRRRRRRCPRPVRRRAAASAPPSTGSALSSVAASAVPAISSVSLVAVSASAVGVSTSAASVGLGDGLRLVGDCLDGRFRLVDRGRPPRSGRRSVGGSGRFSAIVAKRVGSSSASRRSKKAAISASNPATVPWTVSISRSMTAAWCSISVSRRALRSVIFCSVSSRIAGDLGLRPLADRGDVVVGVPAKIGGLGRGPAVDRLDVGLRVGLELAQRPTACVLRGGLHRLRQVGEELVRLLAGRLDGGGERSRGGCGRVSDGCLVGVGRGLGGSLDGLGRVRGLLGRRRRAGARPCHRTARRSRRRRRRCCSSVGSLPSVGSVGAPREPESALRVGRGHASCASPGGALQGVQGVAALWWPVVGVMESARGTSGVRRWYRRQGRTLTW